nr:MULTISPECIES: class C sortase [Bifidobacterium]
MDTADIAAERRRLRRNLLIMRLITILLLIAALAVACFPLALQFQSGMELAKTAATSAQNVANWPYPQADDALKAAHEYNKKLAESGQPILGEAVDPFSGAQGGSQASGEDSASKKDTEYQKLLNTGDEVMGTIKVPKQSINLPIYHGTSEEALASGAGHLYGTSLPVGGESTHSVITGHRGLVEAMMFTRLDEVKKGDFFYIEVMGQTLGYKVDRISVILPNDTSQLKIVKGEDRVTLMTCTPYGVNTHRLLVSGHRVAIPLPAPEPNDVHDARNIAIAAALAVLLLGWFFVWLARRKHVARIMRHAAFWPWQKSQGSEPNNTLLDDAK